MSRAQCGCRALTLAIGDLAVRFTHEEPGWGFALTPEHLPFVARVSPDLSMAVLRDAGQPEPENRIFRSGGNWTAYRNNGEMVLALHRGTAPPDAFLSFRASMTQGELVYRADTGIMRRHLFPITAYPLNQVLYVNLLSGQRKGVLLHAAGMDDGGQGLLFCGVSGAGKSTTARIWSAEPGVDILSDDRIIVRKQGDRFLIHGTPWNGEARFASPQSAPLERLLFLRQGSGNSARSLSESETVARLMTCCFATFWDPDGMAFTLSFLEEMAAALPCYELTFVKDHSVVDFVRQL